MMGTLFIILPGLALWRRFARGPWRAIDLLAHGAREVPPVDVPLVPALIDPPGDTTPTPCRTLCLCR